MKLVHFLRVLEQDVVGALAKVCLGSVPAIVTCLVPALLICLDVVVLGRNCSEEGAVEVAQALSILVLVVAMAIVVRRRPDLRGGAWLALGFFLAIFIREQDALLDDIHHGFWVWPALVVALVSVCLALRRRVTLAAFFTKVRTSRHFDLLTLGLSVLLVFSRIFGNKAVWQAVVGNDDYRVAKHVAEEGVELMGYAILVLWAIRFCRECLCAGRQDSVGRVG